MDFKWIESKRGNPSFRSNRSGVTVSVRANDKRHPIRGQVVVSVSSAFMNQMRWQCGDRLMIGVNGSAIGLKRVSAGGYSLSPVGGTKEARQASVGKSVASVCKMTIPEHWPMKLGDAVVCDKPEVLPDGVVVISI